MNQIISKTIDQLLNSGNNDNTFCIVKNNTVFIIGRRFSGKTTYAKKIAKELQSNYNNVYCVFSLSPQDYKNWIPGELIHYKACSDEFIDKIAIARKNLKCIIVNDNPERNNIMYNKYDNILLIQTILITKKDEEGFETIEEAIRYIESFDKQ